MLTILSRENIIKGLASRLVEFFYFEEMSSKRKCGGTKFYLKGARTVRSMLRTVRLRTLQNTACRIIHREKPIFL